jgi:hypothetical protein
MIEPRERLVGLDLDARAKLGQQIWDEMAQEYGPGYAEHKARVVGMSPQEIKAICQEAFQGAEGYPECSCEPTLFMNGNAVALNAPVWTENLSDDEEPKDEGTWRTRPPAWMAQ